MAKMKIMGGGATCKCTPSSVVWLIIGVIVMAVGLWSLVKGVQMQWAAQGAFSSMLAFWYALGFLVLSIGKIVKCKACSVCFSN